MSNTEINLAFAKAAKGFAEVAEGLSGVLEILSRTANPDRPLVNPSAATVAAVAATNAPETKEQPKRTRAVAKPPAETTGTVTAAPEPATAPVPPVTADKLQQLCVSFAKEESNGQAIVKEAIVRHSGLQRLSELTSDEVRGKIFADVTEQRKKLHESRKTETPAANEFDL